jgi:hypothetical protein
MALAAVVYGAGVLAGWLALVLLTLYADPAAGDAGSQCCRAGSLPAAGAVVPWRRARADHKDGPGSTTPASGGSTMENTHDTAKVNTQAQGTAPAAGAPEAPPQAQDGHGTVQPPDQPTGQTPEQEAADKAAHDAAIRDAERLADKGIAAYVAGQRAELRQTMEACSCWQEYLLRRMALVPEKGARAQRADAVKRLELELAVKCQRSVSVNDLLRAWAAWKLLAEEPGLMGDAKRPGPAYHVPLHVYRDVWANLTDRVDKDSPKERWSLLEGMEDKCRQLFREAVENQVAKAAADAMVRELVAEHAKQQGAARRAEAERLAKEQRQAEAAQQQALAEAEAAQEALARSIAATEVAQEAEKARLAQEAEAAKQELLAKQQAVARANAEAEAKRKAQERAEQQRREQEERARKAEAKLQQAGEKGKGKPRESRAESLLKPQAGKGDDPVARAAMAAEFIAEAEDPAAVLIGLLEKLARNEGLHQRVKTGSGRKLLKLLSLAPEATEHQLNAAILALTPKTAAAGSAA